MHTGAEFERLSWHDCYIWGVEFGVGDAATDDWTSDLILDIDFIVEWLCGVGRNAQFRVAPATLTFHGVTDPRISVDWGSSGFQTALHGVSIDRIERGRVANQKVFLDRPYYSWRIVLNWPKDGFITFGAVDFTQTLLAEPVLTERQHLTLRERRAHVKKSDR
jgi:hypothetical protein